MFVILAVTCFASCEVAPGTCINGIDTFGRGPYKYIMVACTPSGNDLSCTATKTETGYCDGPDVDETNVATWASSDPSIVVLTAPGKFHVVSDGQVEITAKYQGLPPGNVPPVWLVSPVSPPERLSSMSLKAIDPSKASIAGVQMSVFPERGPAPQCVTDASGSCKVYVLKVAGEVVADKDGYQQARLSYVVDGNWGSGYDTSKTLTLTPN